MTPCAATEVPQNLNTEHKRRRCSYQLQSVQYRDGRVLMDIIFTKLALRALFVEVFVLSIVLEETIYCFRELSLWENGLKEIQFGI